MGALLTRRPLVALLVACQALVVTGALAGTLGLPQPTEAVILTVSGRISIFNRGDTAQFDRPMLEALGTRSFTRRRPGTTAPSPSRACR
jgi:hypothetical protein